jgi:hypothetical protein
VCKGRGLWTEYPAQEQSQDAKSVSCSKDHTLGCSAGSSPRAAPEEKHAIRSENWEVALMTVN